MVLVGTWRLTFSFPSLEISTVQSWHGLLVGSRRLTFPFPSLEISTVQSWWTTGWIVALKGPLRNRCPKFFFVQKKLYYITSNRPPAAPRRSWELIFGYVSGLGFPGGLAGHMVSCCYDWFTYFTVKCTAKMILKLLSVATKYIKLFIRNHVRNTFDIAFWDHVLSPRVVLSNRKS